MIKIKQPSECSKKELKDFYQLMVESNEVDITGLMNRIKNAHLLAFYYIDEQIVSIASLKNPSPTYRWKITTSANFPLDKGTYQYELGWIFTSREHRGKGYSSKLIQKLLSNKRNIFATIKEQNKPSISLLTKLGFKQVGNKYKSTMGNYNILLFVN